MKYPRVLSVILLCVFTATLGGGDSVRAQVNVTERVVSANVTMLWEADSYTPPFYRGKALYPDGGDFRILAVSPASAGDPSSLSYTWKIDGEVQQNASGIGRSFFVYHSGILGGSPLIVVEISRDRKTVGVGALRVPLVEPSVIVYPALPLAGILFGNSARSVDGDEITLEAYPLFFGVETKRDPSLTYLWNINNTPAENPLGNAGRLVLRSESGGDVFLRVEVHNNRNVLESAESSMTLTFEE